MSLDFRICAAMFYQVRRMSWISAGVGWSASIAVSMVHLLAHPFDDLRGGRGGVGGDQARSQPEAE